jgi:hypothetical protein
MAVSGIAVTVYCDGGYHEPETLRFHGRALKSDIAKALRERGWVSRSDGRTFCPRHKAKT